MDPDVQERVARWGYETPGFAARYDAARPRPPAALLELVPPLLGEDRIRLVVDLGSGTGRSTRFWAGVADEAIGVEPSAEMRGHAAEVTTEPNVRYVEGTGARTGLPAGSADLVTASQSIHWMDPEPTFAEIARILRPGGVLCAYEYFRLQTPTWEPEAAWDRVRDAVSDRRRSLGIDDSMFVWRIDPVRIRATGLFDHVREIATFAIERGDGARLVDLVLSEGSLQTILATGATEDELGVTELRRIAAAMPEGPWWLGYHVWLARRAPESESER